MEQPNIGQYKLGTVVMLNGSGQRHLDTIESCFTIRKIKLSKPHEMSCEIKSSNVSYWVVSTGTYSVQDHREGWVNNCHIDQILVKPLDLSKGYWVGKQLNFLYRQSVDPFVTLKGRAIITRIELVDDTIVFQLYLDITRSYRTMKATSFWRVWNRTIRSNI